MADVIYLTVWQVIDPMTRIVREFLEEVRSNTRNLSFYISLRFEINEELISYHVTRV